jgi:hypothetical protein
MQAKNMTRVLSKDRQMSSKSFGACLEEKLGMQDNVLSKSQVYNMKRKAQLLLEGTSKMQFDTYVDRLERLKLCDKDMIIQVQSFPDNIEVTDVDGGEGGGEGGGAGGGEGGAGGDGNITIKSNRLVCVNVVMGSAIRLAKADNDAAVALERAQITGVDAAHLTNRSTRGVMYDQVMMIGDRTILVEQFGVTGYNEDEFGWKTHFTLGKEYLFMESNDIIIINDRKQSIEAALLDVLPDNDRLACKRHLQDNLKALGKGVKDDLQRFNTMVYARSKEAFTAAEETFKANAKDITKQYVWDLERQCMCVCVCVCVCIGVSFSTCVVVFIYFYLRTQQYSS